VADNVMNRDAKKFWTGAAGEKHSLILQVEEKDQKKGGLNTELLFCSPHSSPFLFASTLAVFSFEAGAHVKISNIDIGNYGSAFVEVLVGRRGSDVYHVCKTSACSVV
jgi:hypothetical protein